MKCDSCGISAPDEDMTVVTDHEDGEKFSLCLECWKSYQEITFEAE